MSKITLEPNSSGAGTFSIVSPDSNTNRTLNLPDEAGKLISTGNDDPAEVFKQSNILGTVSESGGVPTGAIIERDSNSNGEFVKYADGTMLIFARPSGLNVVGSSSVTKTFPATFSSNFIGAGCTMERGSGSDSIGIYGLADISTTQYNVYKTGNNGVEKIHVIAIGRWY